MKNVRIYLTDEASEVLGVKHVAGYMPRKHIDAGPPLKLFLEDKKTSQSMIFPARSVLALWQGAEK